MIPMDKNSGIYQITCILTGKVYIGSAKKFSARKAQHLCGLRKNNHKNPPLQNAFNKYGEEAFTFEILEYVPVDQLIDAEQTYLDLIFDPFFFDQEKRFNISPKAESTLGIKFTEEQKAKLSVSRIGYKHSQETKEKIRLAHLGRGKKKPIKIKKRIKRVLNLNVKVGPVQQINLDTGDVIAEYETTHEASKHIGIPTFAISRVVNQVTNEGFSRNLVFKSAGGFGWRFKDNF